MAPTIERYLWRSDIVTCRSMTLAASNPPKLARRPTNYAGDYTGRAVLSTVADKATQLKTPFNDTQYVSQLLVADRVCFGAPAFDLFTGQRTMFDPDGNDVAGGCGRHAATAEEPRRGLRQVDFTAGLRERRAELNGDTSGTLPADAGQVTPVALTGSNMRVITNHPNVTVVYDIGQHDGAPYVVQELLEGETLRAELSGGRFSPRKAIEYAIQIARRWNVKDSGVGYVTRFQVLKSFMDRFPLEKVGGREHTEWWIPAELLEEMNDNIVGLIEVIGEYHS